MNKRKKANRIDQNGEMIMASKGVDLDSLDLEDLVERPESSPSKEKEDLARGAQVELVCEFKSNAGDVRLCEYTGQLVGSNWSKLANQRDVSVRMSLEYALELSDLLASGISCMVKKLDIRYINPPSEILKEQKEWLKKIGGISLSGVEIKDIANSTALCVLTFSGSPFIDSIFSNGTNSNKYQIQPLSSPWMNIPPIGVQPYTPPPVVYPGGTTVGIGTVPETNINDVDISSGTGARYEYNNSIEGGTAGKTYIGTELNALKQDFVEYLYKQSTKDTPP